MVLCLGSHSRAPAAHDEAPASRRARPTQDRAPFVRRAEAAQGLRVRTPPTGEWRWGVGRLRHPARTGTGRTPVLPKDL
jgi:hypothetical protein